MCARLEYEHAGSMDLLELGRHPVTLGRSLDCEIVLSSGPVSRRHAQVEAVDGGYEVRDLGSRNGTAVNGVSISAPTLLHDRDRITICEHDLSFRSEPNVSGLEITMLDHHPTGPQIVSTMDLSGPQAAKCSVEPAAALQAVLDVTKELGSDLGLEHLLPRVLATVFRLYPHADRGVILLADEDGELVPRAVKTRGGAGGLQISRAVVARAMQQRQAILSTDAASDLQFGRSESLQQMPIHSLVCVPLLARTGPPLGVIELHSEARRGVFTAECLDLLVSVISVVAVAVENAKLHESALLRDRLQRDLAHARKMQRSLLPSRVPDLPGYRFFVHYQAAHSVGGDYYGFTRVRGDRLAVAVADVSGKGLPAALMMARLSSDVRFALLQEEDPAAALVAVNRSLLEAELEDRFVTFVLMVLDPVQHRLALANAGHNPPLLRRSDGTVVELVPECVGVPLNITDDPAVAPGTLLLDLAPGETVLAYTDGVTEATNAEREMFGVDWVRDILARSSGDPEQIGQSLRQAVSGFASGMAQRDDLTIVCFGRDPGGLAKG